jgi:dTDP-4-amino-4,6-dideoxygalactose transaminase
MIPIAKPIIDDAEKKRVMDVLDSGMISIGQVVKDFEADFARFTGSRFAVAASSGTTALHLALLACGIKEGDKVLTTPFSFIATANSALYCGAVPVFCDIEDETFNMDPAKIRQALKEDPRIKALLIVHLFGHPCDMDAIMEIVREHGLILIEDCAQAHGALYNGRHVGTFGHAGIFSFYPTKNMTTAEGGMVITDSEETYKELKLLREHGDAGTYDHHVLGYNFRMTNIEAAIGIAQLEKLPAFNKARKDNAAFYDRELMGLPWLTRPVAKEKCTHCYHQYSIKVEDRDNFARYLKEKGIGFKIYYPSTIPDQTLYKKLGYDGSLYPVSHRVSHVIISIPVHPALTPAQREEVAQAIREFKPARVAVS